MDNDELKTQQVITTLVTRAANQIAEGKSKQEVVAGLVAEGLSEDFAHLVADKGQQLKHDSFRNGGQTTMLIGAGVASLAGVISYATY